MRLTWLAGAAGLALVTAAAALTVVLAGVGSQNDSGNSQAGGCGTPVQAMPAATVTGGPITVGQANLAGFQKPSGAWVRQLPTALRGLTAHHPDFLTFDEVARPLVRQFERALPGYAGFQDPTRVPGPGGGQSLDQLVAWKSATWTKLAAARVQLGQNVEMSRHGPVTRDRFATWMLLQRKNDGALVAVVSTHLPVNPAKYGPNRPLRQRQYGHMMRVVTSAVRSLSAYGPVFVGGDFNVHPRQVNQPWSGPATMKALGYRWYSRDVDYIYYPTGVRRVGAWTGPISISDHPWVAATFHIASGSRPASSSTASVTAQSLAKVGLDRSQLTNATTIVSVGQSMHVPTYGLVIALAAALQESDLRNLAYGDADSLGLFQQRPSQGWGTPAQVRDPVYAATAFYSHLFQVKGWMSLSVTDAAQAVQHSGFPFAYAAHAPQAQEIVTALGGGTLTAAAATSTGCVSVGTGPFTPSAAVSYVGPVDPATLQSRMQRIETASHDANVDPFFGTEADGTWYRDCQHFVAVLDGRPSSGYATAAAAWSSFKSRGVAHPAGGPDGMAPPVGAWLYYAPNHVAVYLGNNLVASTDVWGRGTAKIGSAEDITGGVWHLNYLGWVAPWGQAAPPGRTVGRTNARG